MSDLEHTIVEKQRLRTQFLSMRKAISLESVEQRSYQICEHLVESLAKVCAVLFYMPVNREVDLLPLSLKLFDAGVSILFPRVINEQEMEAAVIHDPEWDFVKGSFNIPEPRTEAFKGNIDVILVPGVVFDEQGHRIGYGKGYYDRFLDKYPASKAIGVAFRFQVVPGLPVMKHDKPLQAIVTEDGYKNIKKGR